MKIIENITGKTITFYEFYHNGNVDEVDSFNAYYSEVGRIIHLILLITVDKIPEQVCDLKSLKVLYMEGNDKTILPQFIGNLSSLKDLAVHRFNLEKVPETLCELKNLKILRFSKFNEINFPKSMNNLISLEIFGLYESNLKRIPNFIIDLESLKKFELPTCFLKKTSNNLKILKSLEDKGVKIQYPKWI